MNVIRIHSSAVAVLVSLLAFGCGSKPPPNTGFMSDYSKLKKADGERMRYTSPKLKQYSSFLIEPPRMLAKDGQLSAEQRQEVAKYFDTSLRKGLTAAGYTVTDQPGPGVARVRVALTAINESAWWMNIHPGTKITGAGKGGAAMEGEVVDSVSGEQLGAVIQAGKGGQFTLNPFSTIEDVKATIDEWTKTAVKRLDDMRKRKETA